MRIAARSGAEIGRQKDESRKTRFDVGDGYGLSLVGGPSIEERDLPPRRGLSSDMTPDPTARPARSSDVRGTWPG